MTWDTTQNFTVSTRTFNGTTTDAFNTTRSDFQVLELSSSPQLVEPPDPEEPAHRIAFYVVIGTIGIIGNGMVISVLGSSKTLRTKFVNIFLISQSCLDFICSVLTLATSANRIDTGNHYGLKGKLECILWEPKTVLWAFLLSSTYNLVAMSIERYICIVFPMFHKTRLTYSHAAIMITIAWLIGPCYNAVMVGPTSDAGEDGYCLYIRIWPSQFWASFTGVFTIILQFFGPLFVILFTYISMTIVIKRSAKIAPIPDSEAFALQLQVPQSESVRKWVTQRTEKMERAKRNIMKTLFTVSVCFVLCWGWNQIYFTLYNMGVNVPLSGGFYHFTVYALFLNSAINPIIYCIQYADFQKQVKKLIFGKKANTSYTDSSNTAPTSVRDAQSNRTG